MQKPAPLLFVVYLLLAVGVIAYAFLPSPEVVPAQTVPVVERKMEIEVQLTETLRAEIEQQIADYTTQITERESRGEYALDLYFLRAPQYNRLGKLGLALADYQLVVSGDPGNETAWNNLGDLVVDMGDVMAAEEYYKNALQQDPSEVAYNKLYRYYTQYREEDRDQAIVLLLNQALIDNPDTVAFYVKLGRWYVEHDQKKEAVSAYQHAAILSPDSEAIRQELQSALAL